MRIVGAFEFLLSFLYIHYIGFPEKHQAGLRLGVMQYGLLAAVSAYRVFLEPVSAAHKAVARRSPSSSKASSSSRAPSACQSPKRRGKGKAKRR